MTHYHIYHSTGINQFEVEPVEIQHREYAGFVEADSLEKAFEYAQNDHVNWAMNEVRSTSVGDVIQADDGFYMVCRLGFRLLDIMSKNDSELNSLENQSITLLPEQHISFNDWCRELNVSSRVPKY